MHAKRNDKNVPLNSRRPKNGKASHTVLGRNNELSTNQRLGYSFLGTASQSPKIYIALVGSGRSRIRQRTYVIFLVAHLLLYITNNERIIIIKNIIALCACSFLCPSLSTPSSPLKYVLFSNPPHDGKALQFQRSRAPLPVHGGSGQLRAQRQALYTAFPGIPSFLIGA